MSSPPLTIFDLDEDLLVRILRLLDHRKLSRKERVRVWAVCKAFRDLYHARATSVTLSRPYVLRRDETVVATMASCPKLVRATATENAFRAWVWPTAMITHLRHLTVPMRWPEDEISSSLQSLDLTGSVRGARAWMDRILAKMTASQCVVTVQLFDVEEEDSAEWDSFDFARLQLSCVSVKSQALVSTVVAAAGPPIGKLVLHDLRDLGSVNRQLRNLDIESGFTSREGIASLAGPGLASLTCLCMSEGCGLHSLQGLADWHLSKLEILCLNCNPVTSLQGLSGAGLGALWWLGANDLRLRNLVGLSAAGLSSLQRLDISENRLKSLDGFDRAGLTKLTHLDLSDNPLTSLRGLGELPALVELDLSDCRRLKTLQPLVAARLDSLRMLCVARCFGLTFDISMLPSSIELCDFIDGI